MRNFRQDKQDYAGFHWIFSNIESCKSLLSCKSCLRGTPEYLRKKKFHPIWQVLQQDFNVEYRITRKQVRKANINYRFNRVRKFVIAWLIPQDLDYNEIERLSIEKFNLSRYDYERALERQRVDYSRIDE